MLHDLDRPLERCPDRRPDRRRSLIARRRARMILAGASAAMCALAGLAAAAASSASAAASPEPVSISVGTSPLSVAADPTTNMIYVANSNSFITRQGSVSVIDGAPYIGGHPNTGKVVATISVGRNPWGIGVDPDNDRVYVSNQGSNSVSVIDGHTNRVIATIGVGLRPIGVGVVPATSTVYIANSGTGKAPGTVSVISTITNKVEKSVAVGYSPFDIGVNTISHTVYVGNGGGNGPSTGYAGTVSVIRGTNVDATVNVEGSPSGIGVDSLTNNVYVANSDQEEGSSDVAVINGASRLVTQIALQAANPQGVAVDQATHAVFVGNSYQSGSVGSLSVINGATDAEIAAVTIGANPWGVSVDPTTDRVYLANDTSPGTVSMLDFKGYPIVGGTPPPTIPTTTTTRPPNLAGTLCGLLVKSGALKTLGLTNYHIDFNHSVVVATFGQCWLVAIRPNNYSGISGGAVFIVEQSLPLSITAAGPGKPATGLGAGAVVYGNSEIPTVAWHHGKGWAVLEYSWDEEVDISKVTAELPTLEAAARQVYAVYG
jgi:YVTN family beta-propeller protein